MKNFTDAIKWKILTFFLCLHMIKISYRYHKKQKNIFADRPRWVVRTMASGEKFVSLDGEKEEIQLARIFGKLAKEELDKRNENV